MLSDFDRALTLEWIVTNGLGGYASSTVLNVNTRKYHGLLVAALDPPVKRHLFLTKLNEEAVIRGNANPFFSDEFRNIVCPEGFRRQISFSLDPLPTFEYESEGIRLSKRVLMPYLKNAVVAHYQALNGSEEPAIINVKPLVNSRHFYETTDSHAVRLKFTQKSVPNGVMLGIQPGMGYLVLTSTDGCFSADQGVWIEKAYFRADDSRGENCFDDNYQPGRFCIDVGPEERKEFYITASAGETEEEALRTHAAFSDKKAIENSCLAEAQRRRDVVNSFYGVSPEIGRAEWLDWLIMAADSFLVARRSTGKKSLIAGYHWFEDWGRDALISLPGLTLVTGRFRDAEEILLTFKQRCENGLVPIRFPEREGDAPAYDSVDATLWFFNAVLQYLKYAGDFDFVRRELWDTLQCAIEQHIRGTRFGIHLDNDGLLAHGPRLTWMDAAVDGKPVTPREGKAVDVQALWYNALRLMQILATEFESPNDAENFSLLAAKAKASFAEKFWRSEGGYLFDVVDGDSRDRSLRPNQIIAVSLDFTMLDSSRSRSVVEAVWRNLWGTFGLKTLPKSDPRYVGKYLGGFPERDRAYHNGTVWAWLLGPFTTAFLKVRGHDAWWRKFAFESLLRPLFLEETCSASLGTLSEIFDGDPPHQPRGCISQAWSVAEPLRAYVEDVLLKRPPYEKQVSILSQ